MVADSAKIKSLSTFLMVLFLTLFVSVPSVAEYWVPSPIKPQLSTDGNSVYTPHPVVLRFDPNPPDEKKNIPARSDAQTLPEKATATFSITYIPNGGTDLWGEPCITFPESAKTAFNVAAAIWGNIIQSSVPITIRAGWSDLGSSSTLGYAGGGPLHRNFAGAPLMNIWYSGSLANALNGSDLAPDLYDMHITYNSNFSWYFGTDGLTPADKVDFLTVVLHEIAHGLNFSGSMRYADGLGSWGFETGSPVIYDAFIRDGAANPGNLLTNTAIYPNPSAALGNALTSDNIWNHGANAMLANGGQRVKMYAPSTWQPGSSYSHLDYDTFKNGVNRLMVYALSAGVSTHDPGPVTVGFFKDMGWSVAATPPQQPIVSVSPNSRTVSKEAGSTSFSVVNSGTGTMTWTAAVTSGISWLSITSGSSGTNAGTIFCAFSANSNSSVRTGNVRITAPV